MNTKRLVFMLLVMLGSVAGAWAQNNVITYKSSHQEAIDDQTPGLFKGQRDIDAVITSHTYDSDTQIGTITFDIDIRQICSNAFLNCEFTSIVLPETLYELEKFAFRNCQNLSSIDIPAYVAYTGFYVFNGCSSLKSVTINSGRTLESTGNYDRQLGINVPYIIETFGKQVEEYILAGEITRITQDKFHLATLRKINLPSSVKDIEDYAFSNMTLDTLEVEWQTPIVYSNRMFEGTDISKITLLVPCNSTSVYEEKGWGGFNISKNHKYNVNADPSSDPTYYTCAECGYVDEERRAHVHHYELRSDDTHHWYECTSEEGICMRLRIDVANHNIHESFLCDTENYKCDVCGYVDAEKKSQFGYRDYMRMTAVGGEVTIGFNKTGNPENYTVQVSEDGNHWSEPIELSAAENELATIQEGKTCYFRHGLAEETIRISSSDNSYWSFTMEGAGTIESDGNIVSLLDATCRRRGFPETPQHVFTKLFLNCEKLTVAPLMDDIVTVPQWGGVSMFSGSGIKVAPKLSATTVRDGAYRAMFENCKELVSVPMLPATNLYRCAYWEMFKGCDKLERIEIANIVNMVVEEGKTGRENSLHDMLAGTAVNTNGVIVAPFTMVGDTRITLPSNWQWASKLKLNEDPDNPGNYYTTFYDSRYDYKVENGFKAYSGVIGTNEYDENELRLTATPENIIPKEDGVLIHGGSGMVLLTISNTSADRIEGNVFTGSDTNTTAPDFCYILSYGQDGLGFYKYEEGKALSAHKAYLVYEKPSGAKALRMVFADDEVDGIERISDDSANSSTGIYSISGVRLNKLQKGINIVNGKKVLVK